ncbi:MAG: hypothetical protein K2H64_01060 [Desulfovibrio sp.]|nr:hypothetical protein [Desulfovibrio sp.]
MPRYAGKVKCIYIVPPYNTDNEGWIYNDNVNSPEIRRWLGEVVGKEGETLDRRDRWPRMMYPRLAPSRKFLSEDGIIAVSIDDNELGNLLALMDEIFSPKNRLALAPVLAEPSGGKSKEALRIGHEYLAIFSKGKNSNLQYDKKENSPHDFYDVDGAYSKGEKLIKWGSASLRRGRPKMWFPLTAPDGTEVYPIRNDGKEGRWRWGKSKPAMKRLL